MPGGRVFLSYRRDDTAGHAGRLYDRLNRRFPGRIFMDVVGLEPGVDFVQEIERAVASCDVLIALIGKQWLTITDQAGRRRLERHDDFVRLEIATALRRNVRVIPALVGDAVFPASEHLPKDLLGLARRHAVRVTDTNFDHDVEGLIGTLERLARSESRRSVRAAPAIGLGGFWKKLRSLTPGWSFRIAGAICAALLLIIAAVQYAGRTGSETSTAEIGEPRTVMIELSDDGHATVYRNGEIVGRTPYPLHGHFGRQTDLMLKRDGFQPYEFTVDFNEQKVYRIDMKREGK